LCGYLLAGRDIIRLQHGGVFQCVIDSWFTRTIAVPIRRGGREKSFLLDEFSACNYSYYMKELKISRIGNSRGIRLPATLLKRYRMEEVVLVEEGEDFIVLRPKRSGKLSWKETAAAMAKADEGWKDVDGTVADGLDTL
jgi:antitoxin MazE